MSHVLTIPQAASVTLSGHMQWTDEFDWQPVVQTGSYSLDGALVVEAAAKQAGRPITLAGAQDRGWVTRSDVVALLAAAARPGLVMQLTLDDGRQFDVIFRHEDTPLQAEPVLFQVPLEATDAYVATIRLLEV